MATQDTRPQGAAEKARDAEFERILAFLKPRMQAKCLECDAQEWQVFNDLNTSVFNQPIRPSLIGFRGKSATNNNLPLIAVVCLNCGYTKLFSSQIVLGGQP